MCSCSELCVHALLSRDALTPMLFLITCARTGKHEPAVQRSAIVMCFPSLVQCLMALSGLDVFFQQQGQNHALL